MGVEVGLVAGVAIHLWQSYLGATSRYDIARKVGVGDILLRCDIGYAERSEEG